MSLRLRLLAGLLALAPALALAQSPAPSPMPASADAPRLGIDYEVMPIPAPTYGKGKIEVAEVFSYGCIHCAHFQPLVTAWKKKLAKDVRFEYVPADFGGAWHTFALAYFAADKLHVVDKTHDAVFRAVHEQHVLAGTEPADIAAMYGNLGVDAGKFLAAMNDPALQARLDHARQFALATGIEGTPTLIVAGHYRISATADRGFAGMLATADYLVGLERAAAKKAAGKH